MPSENEVIFKIEASYVLKFVKYERIKLTRHRRYSASVKVGVLKRRGMRVVHDFIVYFHKDKEKWLVNWHSNSVLERDFQSRAVATLNRHFPNGVVRSTESAVA